MARIHEIAEIDDPEKRDRWLAAQLDEMETHLLNVVGELATAVKVLTTELTTTREQMAKSSSRIVWTVLSASITLLVSVVAVVISGAVK